MPRGCWARERSACLSHTQAACLSHFLTVLTGHTHTHRHTNTRRQRHGTSSSPRKQAAVFPANSTLIKNVVIAIHSCCKSRTLVACAYKADTHTHINMHTHSEPLVWRFECLCVTAIPVFPPMLDDYRYCNIAFHPAHLQTTYTRMNWFRIPTARRLSLLRRWQI